VTPLRADRLLALPVRLHGIPLGRPVDLLLDLRERKAVGLEVLCGDEVHRFLPLQTAVVSDDEIAIRSPFLLLEEDELAFYRARTASLSALRGMVVQRTGRKLGTLEDIVVGSDGSVDAVVVDERELPLDEQVQIELESRSAVVS
jgi:sporulation protein YlmC with PRC-barrel domain